MGSKVEQLETISFKLSYQTGSSKRTSDLVRRTSLTGGDHDQEFHNGVIDLGASRLDHEDVLLSDTCENSDACLALEEKAKAPVSLAVSTR